MVCYISINKIYFKMIKAGTTFTICSHEELIKKGWVYDRHYVHEDFPHNSITDYMIGKNEGKVLTVTFSVRGQTNWYRVEENNCYWPVATFLSDLSKTTAHICEEGMTPIYNWFICKHCGANLREIK